MTRRRFRRPRRPNGMTIFCSLASALDVRGAVVDAGRHREIGTVLDLTYAVAFAVAAVAYYRRRIPPAWVMVWFIGPGFMMNVFLVIHPM